jgi:hypothetical protein
MPNKVEIILPSDREIRITCSSGAPRHLVWARAIRFGPTDQPSEGGATTARFSANVSVS